METVRFGIASDGRPIREVTQWVPVSEHDPRGVEVAGYPGRWIVAGVAMPLGVYGAETTDEATYSARVQMDEARGRAQREKDASDRAKQRDEDIASLTGLGAPSDLVDRIMGRIRATPVTPTEPGSAKPDTLPPGR